jgi:hypothetical protein
MTQGQAQVQNQDELASGLTERQIADTYRAQIKDLSHVVIDAMDEYQNIDQHQVDKVFEQVADVIRKAAFRSVARSGGRGTAAWTQYADSPETQAYGGSHALKIGIRLGTLVTLRKKNKEMKRPQAGSVLTDADATASLEEGAWI